MAQAVNAPLMQDADYGTAHGFATGESRSTDARIQIAPSYLTDGGIWISVIHEEGDAFAMVTKADAIKLGIALIQFGTEE